MVRNLTSGSAVSKPTPCAIGKSQHERLPLRSGTLRRASPTAGRAQCELLGYSQTSNHHLSEPNVPREASHRPVSLAIIQWSVIKSRTAGRLLVRTGCPVMDKLLYEMAYQQFSGLVPFREKEPYTGAMEITFLSSDQSWFVGTSSSVGNATASGAGWYTSYSRAL